MSIDYASSEAITEEQEYERKIMKSRVKAVSRLLVKWLNRQSVKFHLAIGILLTLALGFLHYLIGYAFRIEVIYIVPVSYVTWYVSKNSGIVISVLSLISILSTDIMIAKDAINNLVECWIAAMFFSFFVIAALILTKFKITLRQRADIIDTLQGTLDEVNELSGILPICANCKKIRDDDGYWHDVAIYISKHSKAEFSHGLCKECATELYPSIFTKNEFIGKVIK